MAEENVMVWSAQAHALAEGNIVEIRGTGEYDGPMFVQSVTATTWISTRDSITTGVAPYGGWWSRHQIRSHPTLGS